MGVPHAVRARVCLERGLVWQAEHWTGAARDQALAVACRLHDLPADYGRGVDRLPAPVLDRFEGTLVRSLDLPQLRRALDRGLEAMIAVAAGGPHLEPGVVERLRELRPEAG